MKEDNIKVDGMLIPLLKNSTTLKPGTKLFQFVAPPMPKDTSESCLRIMPKAKSESEPSGKRRRSN